MQDNQGPKDHQDQRVLLEIRELQELLASKVHQDN